MYEDLIKRLRQEAGEWCTNCCYKCGDNVCGAPDDRKKDCDIYTKLHAADAIEALSKTEKTTRWVPVTERLPEDGKFVLVCNDDGHMMIAEHETETYEWYYKYTNYDFDIWDNEEQGPVRYWMPLPEPPKEE